MKIFLFLSELLGTQVMDCHNQQVGTLCDLVMKMSDEVYPKALCLIIQKGIIKKVFAEIKIEDVKSLEDVIQLKIDQDSIKYEKTKPTHEVTLCRDILDQQVVDIDHQKVVRVNDIHFLRVDTQLYLAHVDVGLRGLVRRLGWTKFVDGVLLWASPKSKYLTQEDFIPWKNTQALTLGRNKNVLRLDVARKRLSQIPPAELAEIMEDLDKFEKISLFKFLDVNLQRKVFTDLSTSEKEELIDQMNDQEAAKLLENIPADEATDLLLTLPQEKTLQLLCLMETKISKKLRKLLGFAKDSAGGLMTTEYLSLPQSAFVKDAIKLVKENTQFPGDISYIYIIDEKNRLVGITSLRHFINVDPNTLLMETCLPKKVFVRTDDGMEEIALLLEKYKFSSVPVLNEKDVLQGVITTDDVMEELISLAWSKYKEKL